MNAFLEMVFWGLAAVFMACVVALACIWIWARRESRVWREMRTREERRFEEVESDRRQWTRFKARANREQCDLSRWLGRNRRLLS